MKSTRRATVWSLEVECEISDDRYLVVFSVHIEELAAGERCCSKRSKSKV
jgi:hypothetical protein